MTPRRRSRGGIPRRKRGWVGLFILVLSGMGIWVGSQLVDADGEFGPARTLPTPAEEALAAVAAQPPIPEVGNRIRVEVLNAGGVRGVAAQARDALRDAGFDVVMYGNASRFDLEASEVLLREGDPAAAHAVARALGITTVRDMPDSTLLVEVTVMLGAKWSTEEWIQRREER